MLVGRDDLGSILRFCAKHVDADRKLTPVGQNSIGANKRGAHVQLLMCQAPSRLRLSSADLANELAYGARTWRIDSHGHSDQTQKYRGKHERDYRASHGCHQPVGPLRVPQPMVQRVGQDTVKQQFRKQNRCQIHNIERRKRQAKRKYNRKNRYRQLLSLGGGACGVTDG